MDQATIETIVRTTINTLNYGFDWKIAFAGIAAIAAFISALGAILTSMISYKIAKLTLNNHTNQKWANDVIEIFSDLDGQDRGMIKESLSFNNRLKSMIEAQENTDDIVAEYNKRMDTNIKEHGRLFTRFRLLFNPRNEEYKSVIDALNGYNTNFLKRFGGDYSDEVRNSFDAFTNELCEQLGVVIHKNIKN